MLQANVTKAPGLEETRMNVAAILKVKGRRVVTTSSDTSLLDITKQLRMHGIGCIVITCSDGKVIGIVSERDIVRQIARAGSKVLNEAGRGSHDQSRCDLPRVRHDRQTDGGDDGAPIPPHTGGRERAVDRPRLHR